MTTDLDAAHAEMAARPDDDAARLRFFARLADTPLLLLLDREAGTDSIEPRLFPLEDGPVVLAFDAEDRMAAFADGPVPYAEVPGRVVAALLAGRGIGLGLNLGVAPSSLLVPSEGIDWLAATLAQGPDRVAALPRAFHVPGGLPDALLAELGERLSRGAGLAAAALLAGVTYDGGRRGHLLAFVDADPAAEPALARAVAEALAFSGVDAGELDVAFLRAEDGAVGPLGRVALRLGLEPAPPPEPPAAPAPPGSDPARPPRLR